MMPGGVRLQRTPTGPPPAALAALAARYVGRRVRLTTGQIGTVSRVTREGLTVAVPGILAEDVAEYLD